MVLSIYGMSSRVAVDFIDRTYDNQIELLAQEPVNSRAVDDFLERIGSITTPEELIEDFEVYSFVMRAFDLEDQIFGKALIQEMLEGDPDDEDALVNRLTDGRFSDLHEALGFVTAEGTERPDFNDPVWQAGMVDKYYQTTFTNEYAEQNEAVSVVLELRDKVGDLKYWYEVMADAELTDFFQTALRIPGEISALDVEKQVEYYEEKFDIANVTNAEEIDRLINSYLAIKDIESPPQGVNNSAALTMMQNAANLNGSSAFLDILSSVQPLTYSSISVYR